MFATAVWQKQRKIRLAILLSGVMHLILLALIQRGPTFEQKTQAPITLSLHMQARAPEEKTPSIHVKPAPPKLKSKPRESAQESLAPLAETKDNLANSVTAEPRRQLTMPSFLLPLGPQATEAPEQQPDEDAGTSAKRALDTILSEHSRMANAKKKGIDARTQQIAKGIQNAFQANVWAVRQVSEPFKPVAGNKIGDALGKAVAQVTGDLRDGAEQWRRDIDARNNPDQSLPKAGSVGLSTAGVDAPDGTENTANPRRPRSEVPMLCFGHCGNTASHERLRLSTTIAIEHDHSGVPVKWSVERSSGQRVFDEDALSSVELALGCMRAGTHHVLFCRKLEHPGFGPVPRYSTWVLHGIVRRWSHTERLLDPQFKPSGRKMGSGIFANDFIESAVDLVQLAYWDVASQPTSVPN